MFMVYLGVTGASFQRPDFIESQASAVTGMVANINDSGLGGSYFQPHGYGTSKSGLAGVHGASGAR